MQDSIPENAGDYIDSAWFQGNHKGLERFGVAVFDITFPAVITSREYADHDFFRKNHQDHLIHNARERSDRRRLIPIRTAISEKGMDFR